MVNMGLSFRSHQAMAFEPESSLAKPLRPAIPCANPARFVEQAVSLFLRSQPSKLGTQGV
jgi:hypothetical protein